MKRKFTNTLLLLRPRKRLRSIVMRGSVCLSLCVCLSARISPDGHTHDNSIYRARIASCGKNKSFTRDDTVHFSTMNCTNNNYNNSTRYSAYLCIPLPRHTEISTELLLRPRKRLRSIVMSGSVCLSLCVCLSVREDIYFSVIGISCRPYGPNDSRKLPKTAILTTIYKVWGACTPPRSEPIWHERADPYCNVAYHATFHPYR